MMGKSSSSPPGPTTPMTPLFGYTKGTITSESQAALNNFKKGTKRDASAYPIFKNMILIMEISMINNSLKNNNLLYILYWLLLSRQTREEN